MSELPSQPSPSGAVSERLKARAANHGKMFGNHGFYTAHDAIMDTEAADLIDRQEAALSTESKAREEAEREVERLTKERLQLDGLLPSDNPSRDKVWDDGYAAGAKDEHARAEAAEARAARLAVRLTQWLQAMETGRSEPLFAIRDATKIALAELALDAALLPATQPKGGVGG